jgi:hypothetical protein
MTDSEDIEKEMRISAYQCMSSSNCRSCWMAAYYNQMCNLAVH